MNTNTEDRKTILLIDDEPDLVVLAQMQLEAAGYIVETAPDGEEGLEKARRIKPDCIISDIVMPRVNGYQMCRALKEDVSTSDIPIILLTSKGEESDKFWGSEVGCDSYLVKPFEPQQLLETITTCMNPANSSQTSP
jgi:twitching motility two-component system response regulator PilH